MVRERIVFLLAVWLPCSLFVCCTDLKNLFMLISSIVWCVGLSGLCLPWLMMFPGCCLLSCYVGCILALYSYTAYVCAIITYARLKFNQILSPAGANQYLCLVIVSRMFCNTEKKTNKKPSNKTMWLLMRQCLLFELEFIYYSLAF